MQSANSVNNIFFYPVFNNNTIKPSYVLNVFSKNHSNVLPFL